MLCPVKNIIVAETQDEHREPHGKCVTYMVRDGTAKLIHPGSCLSNFLGGTDDIRCIFEWSFTSERRTRVTVDGGGGREKR